MSIDPNATQILYINAPNGLNLRSEPGTSSPILNRLAYGAQIQVTNERLGKDGYEWLHLVSGGWVAAEYTQTTPLDVATTSPTTEPPAPSPAPTPPTVTPITIGARGVHASAGGWAPDDTELNLVRRNGVESVLIVAYEPNQAGIAIPRFRSAGVKDFIIRAASHMATPADPSIFVNDTLPRLKEYYNAIGGGSMLIALHNEPNVIVEGWSKAWQNGGDFTTWFLRVADAYRQAFPGARIGFPALSPGGDAPGIREDEWRFAGEASQAIAASDWVGVHAYFVGDGSDIDLKPDRWRTMAQGRTVIVTEGGPADNVPNNGTKLNNVYARCAAFGLPVMAWLLSGAGGWKLAGWKENNVLV